MDQWRALREQVADSFFKLGSVFFWLDENSNNARQRKLDHYFIYLGPKANDESQSFFIGSSSESYWDTKQNFPIVPEDFKNSKVETKNRAFDKTTYFLFSKFPEHIYETADLRRKYIEGLLDYKFNLINDLPDAFKRLETFMKVKLPLAYVKRFFDPSNIPAGSKYTGY